VHRHKLHKYVRFFGFVPTRRHEPYRLASVFVSRRSTAPGLPPRPGAAPASRRTHPRARSRATAALLIDPYEPESIAEDAACDPDAACAISCASEARTRARARDPVHPCGQFRGGEEPSMSRWGSSDPIATTRRTRGAWAYPGRRHRGGELVHDYDLRAGGGHARRRTGVHVRSGICRARTAGGETRSCRPSRGASPHPRSSPPRSRCSTWTTHRSSASHRRSVQSGRAASTCVTATADACLGPVPRLRRGPSTARSRSARPSGLPGGRRNAAA
jgi:hypothetical protein